MGYICTDCSETHVAGDGEGCEAAKGAQATFADATTDCEACGFPVRVLESHGVCIKGEHRGLFHPKCADFTFRIAALYEPPKASNE